MKCCICGQEFDGMGNNPDPVKGNFEGDRCCDLCNKEVVVPARVFILERIKSRIIDEIIQSDQD